MWYKLDDNVLCKIHASVLSSLPEEREGLSALQDRAEREEAARVEVGAERAAKKWQLMGFKTLNGFLAHCHWERATEQARSIRLSLPDIPYFVLLGYDSEHEFISARRESKRHAALLAERR